jgi:hypothetical protein
MMGPNASKLMAICLAATVLAAVPAGAGAYPDYSRNSVNGQASPANQRVNPLDYSRNSVNGENNVVTRSSPSTSLADRRSPDARDASGSIGNAPPVRVVATGGSGGFHWGDAGIGAGGIIVLALVIGIGQTLLLGRRTGSRVAG